MWHFDSVDNSTRVLATTCTFENTVPGLAQVCYIRGVHHSYATIVRVAKHGSWNY